MASHSEQVKPLTEHPGALRPVELGEKKQTKKDTKKVSTDQKGFRLWVKILRCSIFKRVKVSSRVYVNQGAHKTASSQPH